MNTPPNPIQSLLERLAQRCASHLTNFGSSSLNTPKSQYDFFLAILTSMADDAYLLRQLEQLESHSNLTIVLKNVVYQSKIKAGSNIHIGDVGGAQERTLTHFVTAMRPPRQDKLLQRLLVLSSIQSVLAEQPVLWLYGPSGCGKTVLAEQYYHLFLPEYQHVAWIEVRQDFLQDFIAAAPEEVPISSCRARLREQGRLRPEIDLACARTFSQFLANLPGRVLLIIDGVKDLDGFITYYDLLQLNKGHLLITSHHLPTSESDWTRRYSYGAIAAPPLTDEEINLLATQHENDYPWAPEILDHLRHNILLSSILVKNVPRTHPAQVDEQLRILLRQTPPEAVDQSLLTQLFRLFLLAPAERWLLLQWAALPEGFYDRDFVAHLIGLQEVGQTVYMQGYHIFKGQGAYRRMEDSTVRFTELLDQLLKGGWLVANEDEEISLHPALVTMLRAELSPRLDYFVELHRYLEIAFFLQEEIGYEDAEGEIDDRLRMRSNIQYENHLRSLVDLVKDEASEELLSLLYKLIGILKTNLKLAEELKLHERYVQLVETKETGGSFRLAVALNRFGNCYYRNGKFQKAMEQFQKSLAIMEAVMDANHPALASSYNSIAVTYSELGQHEVSIRYHKKSLAIREAVLDANHPALATAYNNIAGNYSYLGQYEEAIHYHKKSLTIMELVLDANHPALATVYNNIAESYGFQSQYEEAMHYHRKSLAIREAVLDANHPDLASSYNNMAESYGHLGQYEERLCYHRKSLAIREAVLDANHPHLAASYNNMAVTYSHLGQHEEALHYHKKSLAIVETVLDANHPDLDKSYNNAAKTYFDLGQHEEALRYHKKSLAIRETVLDANHPALARAYNNIAVTYQYLGQYEEALLYYKKSLAILEEVLEANHLDLVNFYNNIAATYRALKYEDKAEEYEAKADAIRKNEK